MSLSVRRAIISQLKKDVPALKGQVYQAYLVPSDIVPPYATIKLGPVRGSVNLPYAADQSIEVRFYGKKNSFINLELLETYANMTLNGVVLTDDETGSKYWLKWVPFNSIEYVEEGKDLIVRMVTYETAVIHERG